MVLTGVASDRVRSPTLLKPGDHLCCLYKTEEEHHVALTSVLRQGLERGHKAACVAGVHSADAILGHLWDEGVDVGFYLSRGQLSILAPDRTHTQDGVVSPLRMVLLLQVETSRALALGYSQLRVAGEPNWRLQRAPGSSDCLMEFEANVNAFFGGSQCIVMCQYDQRRFDPSMLPGVLATHRKVLIGSAVFENPYYLSPIECLRSHRKAATWRRLFENLMVLKTAKDEANKLCMEVGQVAETVHRQVVELRVITDNLMDAVFAADLSGTITVANEAGKRILGISGDLYSVGPIEFLQRIQMRHPDGRVLGPKDLPLLRAMAGETITQDLIVRDACTREDLPVRSTATSVSDETGKLIGAVEVLRDVGALAEFYRLREQFVCLASHELRTPVTVVKGYAQLLVRTSMDIPAQGRKIINAIAQGADRIDRIINDLLDISQLRLGRLTLAEETFSLPELAEQVVHDVSLTTTKHRIQLKRTDPAVVKGDRYRLEQVLVNLLKNAITYSPEGGDVVVEVAVADQEAVLSVKDSGVGIPKHKQHRIYEHFYRAHAGTRHDYGGIGLGLHISSEIVQRHGGRMWFESEEGKGSAFSFSLPLEQRSATPFNRNRDG